MNEEVLYGNVLDYMMMYSKIVFTQVQEVQFIIHDLLVIGINLFNTYIRNITIFLNSHIVFNVRLNVNDAFQVSAIIEKFPLLWKDLKKLLET